MYKFLEHTADVGIEVEAEDIERLFEEAARAISDFMVYIDRVECKERKEISVEGESLEDLLVNFLTELLALLDSEMFIWRDVKVRIEKDRGFKLHGEVFGERYSEEKHGYKGYIKAITYHGIRIEKNSRYRLRFLIDI